MTATHPPPDQPPGQLPRRIDPTDPNFLIYQNLRDVRNGIKHRAPGIRRCRDCANPYIDDHTGLPHCPDCRTAHRRFCQGCGQLVRNNEEGDRHCASCLNQQRLF